MHVIKRFRREELIAANSLILHEIYFDDLLSSEISIEYGRRASYVGGFAFMRPPPASYGTDVPVRETKSDRLLVMRESKP